MGRGPDGCCRKNPQSIDMQVAKHALEAAGAAIDEQKQYQNSS
jgi:hypothetical protein